MVLLAHPDHSHVVGHYMLAVDDHLLNVGDSYCVDVKATSPYYPHGISLMFETAYHCCQIQYSYASLEKPPALNSQHMKISGRISPEIWGTMEYLPCFINIQLGESFEILLVKN